MWLSIFWGCSAVAFRFHLEFSRTKLGHDCVIVALTIGISLIFLGRMEGIQVGTVVAAVLLGPISQIWINLIYPRITPKRPISNMSVTEKE